MRPPTDDRAVTVQIGTVLLFGILIVLLSVYQASVVPDQNADVEYNHNQRVHGELQDLRDELRQTGLTGGGGSSSVTLGTQYPVRAFFVNPPSPTGSLGTAPPANVTIRNASATGETGDYWTGSARNFSTRGLVYEPNYHVYQDAPTTVHRSSVLYNRFADANVTLAGQRLVEGNAISLIAVDGSYNETAGGTATVDLRAVSPATRTVTVRNETDEAVTLIVPTKLSVTKWEELLESELDPEGDDPDDYVAAVESVADRDAVRVVLEPATYELRLAKVGVGSDVTPTGPHYVTDVRGDNASVAENSTRSLEVEVRDRFNNPVSGVGVEASTASDNSSVALATPTTDDDGRVSLRYFAPENVSDGAVLADAINVSYAVDPAAVSEFDSATRQNLSLDVRVRNADRSGLDDGANINPGRIGSVIVQNEQMVDKNAGRVSFEFNNTGNRRNITAARVNFYYSVQGKPPNTTEIRGPGGSPRTADSLTVGGQFESLNANGGPIVLGNRSVTTIELDFDGKMKQGDYLVMTVIFDSGESSATYFIAPSK